MGSWHCEKYRGHFVRRDYVLERHWWAEREGVIVCYGVNAADVKRRLDDLITDGKAKDT